MAKFTSDGSLLRGSGRLSQSTREWTHFFARCTQKRLEVNKFSDFVSILYARHPLPPDMIALLFLRPRPDFQHSLDPRVIVYVQILQDKKYIDLVSVLRAMYMFSTLHTKANNDVSTTTTAAATKSVTQQQKMVEKRKQTEHKSGESRNSLGKGDDEENGKNFDALCWKNSYLSEEPMFYALVKSLAEGKISIMGKSVYLVIGLLAKWMMLFTAASAAFATDEVMGTSTRDNSKLRIEMEGARMAFVALSLRILDTPLVLRALEKPVSSVSRRLRRYLSEAMAVFVPSVAQGTPPEHVQRLDMFRTQTLVAIEPDLRDKKDDEMENVLDAAMALEAIQLPELHIPNTRAGLYIYLNAALIGRPALEDQELFAFLHNRYRGDMQNTMIDLILASFDVLANAVFRGGNPNSAHVLRSYLINKVPLLLKTLSHSLFPPLTTEMCIREALRQVDQNAFPTMSDMFDSMSNNNTLTDSVRQDFCFACALHNLIPVSSIHDLLGDMTYQKMPDGGRYEKNKLVQDCLNNPERIPSLVGELDNTDGNVGAVSQALVEVMKRLCQNKETLPLKSLAMMLAKKPLSLDVLLLFENPITILRPLCELLDSWRYEEDQGEYQPVYEEFGAVLLLFLCFVHRYNLTAADLGLANINNADATTATAGPGPSSTSSFVAKLLSGGYLSRAHKTLSEKENEHLSGWLLGLFDGDSGGLSDELMSSCPPQEFYLLVPTLFSQIVAALSCQKLAEEALRSGMEYFADSFLVPSLAIGLTFLARHLWTDRPSQAHAVIQILKLVLLSPNSFSSSSSSMSARNEGSSLLSVVVTAAAKPLDHSLRAYQRRDPRNQEIEPLLRILKDSLLLSKRSAAAGHGELESWAAATTSSTSVAVQNRGISIGGTGGLGLAAALRGTITQLTSWALASGGNNVGSGGDTQQGGTSAAVNVMPATYSHRQVLACVRLLGAKKTLKALVSEIAGVAVATSATNTHSGRSAVVSGSTAATSADTAGREAGGATEEMLGVVYDIVAAMICAPDVGETMEFPRIPQEQQQQGAEGGGVAAQSLPQVQGTMQKRIGLRNALRMSAEAAASKKPSPTTASAPAVSTSAASLVHRENRVGAIKIIPEAEAEATIRLYRRVETLSEPLPAPLVPSGADALSTVGDDAVAAAAAAMGGDNIDPIISLDGNGGSSTSSTAAAVAAAAAAAAAAGAGGLEGGLDLGDLDANAFDDMDLANGADDLLDGYGIDGPGVGTSGGGGLFDWEGMDLG